MNRHVIKPRTPSLNKIIPPSYLGSPSPGKNCNFGNLKSAFHGMSFKGGLRFCKRDWLMPIGQMQIHCDVIVYIFAC